MAGRDQFIGAQFMTDWIDINVRPHPFPEDLGFAITQLVEQCISAALVVGISAADIEAETGCHPADLILSAFLARWNPNSGHGGSA
jgi:hypothetical protein